MSLCQLQQRQGKRGAARTLLAPIYHWFTEGFGTPDLQEARALLEDLSSRSSRPWQERVGSPPITPH